MDRSAEAITPAARSEGLVVEHLADETLIYDLERDQVHQLNATATAVFELCDGRTPLAALADRAAQRLERPLTADTVRAALEQLAERELLDRPPELGTGVSRREVVRRAALVGGVAAAAPLITSIVAPTPARAQSPECGQPGANCGSADDCCQGLDCDSLTDECCVPDGGSCQASSECCGGFVCEAQKCVL
jgi:coenzyme PQQ synthesis protein D (PqqD)